MPQTDFAALAASRSATGLIYFDSNNTARWMNESAREVFDLAPDQSTAPAGSLCSGLILEGGRPFTLDASLVLESLRTGRPAGPLLVGRVRTGRSTLWAHVSARPVRDDSGVVEGVVVTLVEEAGAVEPSGPPPGPAHASPHEAEQASSRAERVQSVERLSAGVAHEFNNLLQAVSGAAELGLAELPPGHAIAHDLHDVLDASRRGAALVERLMEYARKQLVHPQDLDVGDVARAAVTEYVSGGDAGVIIHAVSGTNGAIIRADKAAVTTAIHHLLDNAVEAVGGTGTITVTTGRRRLSADEAASLVDAQEGDYVFIAVADDGRGMPPHVMAHALEPFFTTKPFGQKRGLGLSSVYGITTQAGGWVDIVSAEGKGATVTMYFPERASRDTAAGTAREAAADPAVVLVVESDPRILRLAVSMLRRLGYAAIPATSATDALGVLRSEGRIDVLFTAAVLADEDAGVLVAEARRFRPSLRVACTSAYSESWLRHERRAIDAAVPVLLKPFSMTQLHAAIEDALHRMP